MHLVVWGENRGSEGLFTFHSFVSVFNTRQDVLYTYLSYACIMYVLKLMHL